MVEGARLESVYTSKAYREFESLRLRKKKDAPSGAFCFAEVGPSLSSKQQRIG